MSIEITALIVISYATNCVTTGSFAPGVNANIVKEQSCQVTRTISCNHVLADGERIKFGMTEDWGFYSQSFDAAGQCVQQTPLRLLVTETPVVAIVPKTGFVLFTNYSEILIHATPPLPPMPVVVRPGITPLMNLPIPPLSVPGAPAIIPPPPPVLPPLPARRAVP